jgi:hypothetical protein
MLRFKTALLEDAPVISLLVVVTLTVAVTQTAIVTCLSFGIQTLKFIAPKTTSETLTSLLKNA